MNLWGGSDTNYGVLKLCMVIDVRETRNLYRGNVTEECTKHDSRAKGLFSFYL
jgi:hypothetical protein